MQQWNASGERSTSTRRGRAPLGTTLPKQSLLDQARSARRGPGAVTGSCGAAAPLAFGGGAESQPARSHARSARHPLVP